MHNPESSLRSRVFYLFHRFIKEDRNEIPVDLAGSLIEGMRDLLVVQVEVPELDSPDQDLLTEAVKTPGIFDAQLYLFETVGTLISLFYKSPEQRGALLLSVVKPLLDDLSQDIQTVKSPEDVIPILKAHHVIMALGNIAKGFPEFPSPVPDGYILPPVDVFSQVAQAIIVSLEAMNSFRVIRDAVSGLHLHNLQLLIAPCADSQCLYPDSRHYGTDCYPSHSTINGESACSF